MPEKVIMTSPFEFNDVQDKTHVIISFNLILRIWTQNPRKTPIFYFHDVCSRHVI